MVGSVLTGNTKETHENKELLRKEQKAITGGVQTREEHLSTKGVPGLEETKYIKKSTDPDAPKDFHPQLIEENKTIIEGGKKRVERSKGFQERLQKTVEELVREEAQSIKLRIECKLNHFSG